LGNNNGLIFGIPDTLTSQHKNNCYAQ